MAQMKIKRKEFIKQIVNETFNGNVNQCSKALEIEPSQLHKFIKKEKGEAGAKFLGGLYKYCEKHEIDHKKYIFVS